MQIANIILNLGGDAGQQVQKYGVTPSEVAVLRLLHGDDAVNDIEIVGDDKRSSRAERERLMGLYARQQPNGGLRSPALDELFPGVAARLYEDFDEMELDEIYFKTDDRKATERRIASRDPLDVDGKQAKKIAAKAASAPTTGSEKGLDGMTKAELAAYAKASGIDFDAAANKAALLATIQAATAGGNDAASPTGDETDEDDADFEDINDGQGGKNIFEE